jgi:hypothetical protein
MASEIPQATLAAGDQSDPAWWLEAAVWLEYEAASDDREELPRSAWASAAALACRTFAAMMERAASDTGTGLAAEWEIADDGDATWIMGFPRSLPAAAVAALTEDA